MLNSPEQFPDENYETDESTDTLETEPKKLVVFIPLSPAVELDQLSALSNEVIKVAEETKGISEFCLILVPNTLDKDGTSTRKEYAEEVSRQIENRPSGVLPVSSKVMPVDSGKTDERDPGRGRHVNGFCWSAREAGPGGLVGSIDSRAHRAIDLKKVFDILLRGNQAAMSTRYLMEGAHNGFRWDRQASSVGVTIATNLALLCYGPRKFLPDFTSGLEGYTADILNTIFKVRPPEDWITMRTMTMVVNTELRLYVLWALNEMGYDLDESVEIFPIVYAQNMRGKSFTTEGSLLALKGIAELLISTKGKFLEDLRQLEKKGA